MGDRGSSDPVAGGEKGSGFERWIDRFRGLYPKLIGIARRITRSEPDAEDVCQNVFLRVQRALDRGTQPEDWEAWLVLITRNLAIDRFRARAREPGLGSLDADRDAPAPRREDPANRALHADIVQAIDEILLSLPARQREVLLLRDREGYTSEEIARMLGCRSSTARVHLMRARARVREALRERFPTLDSD